MINPAENNWYLPLKGEEWKPQSDEANTAMLVLNLNIKFSDNPIHNEMRATFWQDHFSAMPIQELALLKRRLTGSPSEPGCRTKVALVAHLTNHFNELLERR